MKKRLKHFYKNHIKKTKTKYFVFDFETQGFESITYIKEVTKVGKKVVSTTLKEHSRVKSNS